MGFIPLPLALLVTLFSVLSNAFSFRYSPYLFACIYNVIKCIILIFISLILFSRSFTSIDHIEHVYGIWLFVVITFITRYGVAINTQRFSSSAHPGGDELSENSRRPLPRVCDPFLSWVSFCVCLSDSVCYIVFNSRLCINIVCVCVCSMITLKVLNSIVLLGKSCVYVKEANMEEKLFQSPPSATPSRASSRAHHAKRTREPTSNSHTHTLHAYSPIYVQDII